MQSSSLEHLKMTFSSLNACSLLVILDLYKHKFKLTTHTFEMLHFEEPRPNLAP